MKASVAFNSLNHPPYSLNQFFVVSQGPCTLSSLEFICLVKLEDFTSWWVHNDVGHFWSSSSSSAFSFSSSFSSSLFLISVFTEPFLIKRAPGIPVWTQFPWPIIPFTLSAKYTQSPGFSGEIVAAGTPSLGNGGRSCPFCWVDMIVFIRWWDNNSYYLQ